MGLLSYTQECKNAAQGELPKDEKGKTPVRMDVYENKFIEKYFAQAHWTTPLLWLPVAAYGLYVGIATLPIWLALPAFFGGLLSFTFIEYMLHRYPFHYDAKSDRGKMNVFLMHGYHHDFPQDPTRLVLPLIAILPLAAIVGSLYGLIFGSYFWPVYGGTALGYVAYDLIHYGTHHFDPKLKFARWFARYHMLHHFDSPKHRYGISSPLWDLVFGTFLNNRTMWRKLEKERKQRLGEEIAA